MTSEFQNAQRTIQDTSTISQDEKKSISDILSMLDSIQNSANELVDSVNKLIQE
jgi:hypothetical protein